MQYPGLLEILQSVLGPTESEPGCLSCRIYEQQGPNEAIVLCAHWKTSAALYAHIHSDVYLRVLSACELSSRPPEFCFHHVARTQGMDLINQLRGASGEQTPGS